MLENLSILHDGTPTDITVSPFFHIERSNCLDSELYSALALTMPKAEQIASVLGTTTASIGSNVGFGLSGQKLLDAGYDVEPWRSFFAYHLSREFYLEVLAVFKQRILEAHPTIESTIGRSLEECSVSPRTHDTLTDIKVDCQFWYNTPVSEKSSVREAHVDKPTRLYSALLYFRTPEDDSDGGDLNVYRWYQSKQLDDRCHVVDGNAIAIEKTVPYESNRLIFFVNSENALHGVTPRSPTPHTRQFINFLAEVNEPLFNPASLNS